MMDHYGTIELVREKKPLVHHITNWVTIYDCANMTRAFGGLPVMAHAGEEVSQMAGISSALVLNIGTLTKELVDSMIVAAKSANRSGIPVVLDAVGVGATDFRTESANRIMEDARVDIIKGNYGEIGVLAGENAKVRGVESGGIDADPVETCKNLSRLGDCAVAMTGEKDIVAQKDIAYILSNGDAMMGCVVGTGCMAASVMGAAAAVGTDIAVSAVDALTCYGVAAELAAKGALGPASFKNRFYDAIWNLKREDVERLSRVERVG